MKRSNIYQMKRKTALIVAMLLMTMGIKAQTTLRLSLVEAQDYALQHNYAMQNASLDVKKAEAARWQTLATMLPQLKAGFDYSNMCGYTMDMQGMSIPLNPNGTLNATASIAISAQQVMGAIMQKVSIEMSDITRQKNEMTTRLGVKNIYVSILVMEDIIGLLDSSLINMQQLEKSTIASVQAGAAEQINADKLSVQVASLKNSINSNKRSLEMLYNTLILQLGAAVDSKLELTTKLDDIFDIQEIAKKKDEQFDLENNYDYQLLKKSERLARQQLTTKRLVILPTLSFYYQYSAKTYFNKPAMFNMTPPNMIGASISLPLFQSGSRDAAIYEAKIAYQETLNSKRQAEDGLKVQFNQVCYDLMSAVESYMIQKDNLTVSKRVFTNTSEKYQYGRASSLEVTNASTDLITAQSNYVQAVMNVITAQISLEELMGKTNE